MHFDDRPDRDEHSVSCSATMPKTDEVVYHDRRSPKGPITASKKPEFIKLGRSSMGNDACCRFRFGSSRARHRLDCGTRERSAIAGSRCNAVNTPTYPRVNKQLPEGKGTLGRDPAAFVVIRRRNSAERGSAPRREHRQMGAITSSNHFPAPAIPSEFSDIWHFKDKASYEKNTKGDL